MNSIDTSAILDKNKNALDILFKKKSGTLVQLFRYAIVGGCAYVIDFGALIFLTDYLMIHYLVSAAVSFTLGLLTNYILSILWVFSKRTLSNKQTEFLVFALIGIIGLGFNEAIMWIFTGWAAFHYIVSKLFATGFVFFWNFFARKKILFS